MKAALVIGILAVAGPLGAHADCSYPKTPVTIPDGKTATEPEMIAAMQQFKQYNQELATYTGCLEQETTVKLKDASLTPEAMMQVKAMQARKNNSAIGEAQAKAGQFNEQVRIFKARST